MRSEGFKPRASAHVFCNRRAKNGAFIRLKKDFYVLVDRWPYLDRRDFSTIANHVQIDATFTHGLCPDCINRFYPEIERDRQTW